MLENFSLNSVVNPLAVRPGLIELRGHRVPLPGVSSYEPLLRGCDQREWLEKLTAMGIRHLVVLLNSREEDTCLFARRHPVWDPGSAAVPSRQRADNTAFYDLQRRDEGVFTRLRFLLDEAEKAGVLTGLSLINIAPSAGAGPFRREASAQGVSLAGISGSVDVDEASLEKLESAFNNAIDWVGAEVRRRRAVWLEPFRGQGPRTHPALRLLEARLTRRLAQILTRGGEDQHKAGQGPWVAVPPDFAWEKASDAHAAPFVVRPGSSPEESGRRAVPPDEKFDWTRETSGESSGEQPVRRPEIYCFPPSTVFGRRGADPAERARLWRAVMSGCWPIVHGGFSDKACAKRWSDVAQLAVFAKQWVGRGYLRPCPETLALLAREQVSGGKIIAATDGCGRYYVFFEARARREPLDAASPRCGVTLATLPGSYRYYWFDPVSGKGLDHGDGIVGGLCCRVPGHDSPREAVLILEQEALPDPLSVW
jgi:hypothetical protein